jgi:hypothetical protein
MPTSLPLTLPILLMVEEFSSPPLFRALPPVLLPPSESPPGNKTLPFALKPSLPPKVLNAAMSFASLSRAVLGRAGDGDVARYNIKSAASLSVGADTPGTLGVVCAEPGGEFGGGVATRNDDSAEGGGATVPGSPPAKVRAELCAKCEREWTLPVSALMSPRLLLGLPVVPVALPVRDCNSKVVKVAAAFISISASARTLCGVIRSFCFPFLSLPFVLRVTEAFEPEPRPDLGVVADRAGADGGGSLGLCIVRACLVGGGASIEENKL